MPGERGDARLVERAPGERRVARGIDALAQAQAHEQELVGLLLGRQPLALDKAVPLALDPLEPGLGRASPARRALAVPERDAPWAPGPMPTYSP